MHQKDMVESTLTKIARERSRIIEDYIRFYLATLVPDDFLTPEWLAENICLIEKQTARGLEMYIGFKNECKYDIHQR